MKRLILLITLVFCFLNLTYAQSGTLDSSFGIKGVVDYANGNLTCIAIQSDYKVVAAGSMSRGNATDIVVVRYNSDGSMDKSFGQDGVAVTDFAKGFDVETWDRAAAIAIQSDGKIIVAGETSIKNGGLSDFALVRYNTDGSLDSTFDEDGKQSSDFSSSDHVKSIVIQGDGKIVVAGTAYNHTVAHNDFAVARYNKNGSLDNSFDYDGKATVDFSADADGSGVAIQTDGKIVVVGSVADTTYGIWVFCIARFNRDGSPDVGFAYSGKQIDSFFPVEQKMFQRASSVLIQKDGKIVVAGGVGGQSGVSDKFFLARYNANGELDNTFDGDGKLITSFPYSGVSASAASAAIQDDGKIVAGGFLSHDGSPSNFKLIRYNIDGSLDNSFSQPEQIIRQNKNNYLGQIVIKNNKLYAIGSSSDLPPFSGTTSLVAKYNLQEKTQTPPTIRIATPANNTTYVIDANVEISANAEDPYGSISRVEFYKNDTLIGTSNASPYVFKWNNVPAGDYSITAKAVDNDSMVTTSDPVLISVYNNTKVAPSVSLRSPRANTTFAAPASITISATAEDTDGSIRKVDFYNNDTLIGTAATSPYTFTWNNVPAGDYSITAKATDNDLLATTSDPVKISVHNPKVAPSVSISNPLVNATFTAPASITIDATAEDTDGAISKVEFYNNDTLIGTATSSPYTFIWNNVPAGNYSITAKATDNDTLVSTSKAVQISVYMPKVAPSVSISSPLANATFVAPASIIIDATAEDTDGSISKVDFYSNDKLIGTATSSPYTFIWSNVPAGNYSITAKATDSDLLVTTSDPVKISVHNSKVAPSVSISSPLVNATFTAPASIIIDATAEDTDGSISKVDFYSNDILVGTVTKSPYVFSWVNVPAGNYTITAKAIDNDSLVTTSKAVQISVVPNKPPIVSITAPANGENFTSPAIIPLKASATDPEGKISKVEFYNGATLLKTLTDAPYNYHWENASVGSYKISAVATDNYGLATSSEAITLTVTAKDSIIVKCAPNPATNIVNISTIGFEHNKTLSISIIASGVVFKMIEVNNTGQTVQLDVSPLVSGIYTLKLTCGDKVISKQFLKL